MRPAPKVSHTCLMRTDGDILFLPGLHLLHSKPTHTRRWAWVERWSWAGGSAVVELVESWSNTASSGNFNVHRREGQSNGRWHVLTLGSGPFEPRVASRGGPATTKEGCKLDPAIRCPPPPPCRRGRLVVVRTHTTALVTASLGQRHVSSECDLVTREARERLPVRGFTIALGSRHLFRLNVKAQCRFLPDQSSCSLPCRPSSIPLACPASPCLIPTFFPHAQRSKMLG